MISVCGRLFSLQTQITGLDGSIIPLTKETFDFRLVSFSSGKGSLIDVMDALETLRTSLRTRVLLEGEQAKTRALYYRAVAAREEERWK